MEMAILFAAIVFFVLNAGFVALVMWISYRLVVSAVRTAILEADLERERRAGSLQEQQQVGV